MAKKGNGKSKNGKGSTKFKLPKRYEDALKYPLFDSIFNRRSRRFGLGMELPDQTLGFKSKYDPVPLEEMEEALLAWSGTGLTGLCLADLPPETGIDLLCQWTGRTWPSACNNHGTELFFTNDEGVFYYKTDTTDQIIPKKRVRISTLEDRKEIIEDYEKRTIKLKDGRSSAFVMCDLAF